MGCVLYDTQLRDGDDSGARRAERRRMDLLECIDFLKDTCAVNTSDADREIVLIRAALKSAENALLDYVEKFEQAGATMGYGRAVLVSVKNALAILSDD